MTNRNRRPMRSRAERASVDALASVYPVVGAAVVEGLVLNPACARVAPQVDQEPGHVVVPDLGDAFVVPGGGGG